MSAVAAVLPDADAPPRVRIATALAGTIVGGVVLAGVLGPFLGYDPVADVNIAMANVGPSAAHWLGTDHLGRDVFMRLLLAARWFVLPGALACVVAAALGIPAGALSGWYGGPIEGVVRWLLTVVGSVPRFVLVLLALAIYGDSPLVLALTAGLSFAPLVGEAVHARIEELRTADYVLASRAHGLGAARILWVHLVWAGARHAIARQLVGLFGYFVVLETTLSYIGGFGVQQPEPSWGNMLVFGWGDANPWSAMAPAIAIAVTVACTARLGHELGERRDG